MPNRVLFFAFAVMVALTIPCVAQEEADLIGPLEPFRPLLGNTYRAEFPNEATGVSAVDVQSWERVLNGQGIKMVHSVNDGNYGGETMFVWDPNEESIVYYYFTTAGFMTRGSMTVEDGAYVSHEKIEGEGTDVTEVKSTMKLDDEGSLHVTTSMLRNGEWEEGNPALYRLDHDAKVIFK